MTDDTSPPADYPESFFTPVWPLYTGAIAVALAATLLAGELMGGWFALRLALIAISIAAATAAVILRPRSPVVLAAAAVAALSCGSAIAEPINDHTDGQNQPSSDSSSVRMLGQVIEVPEGKFVDGPVATFVNSPGTIDDQNITIAWGDGTSSPGYRRLLPDGHFAIQGRKTYDEEGIYTVKASLRTKEGQTFGATSIARVTRWEGSRFLLWVIAAVSAVAGVVVVLPVLARRIVVSLLILVHFGGIFSAVTNISNFAPAPWWSQKLWYDFYRPYLQFMYLNNAYHYYSPNPGPASLLWLRIEYEPKDGMRHWRWVKMPELDENGNPISPDGGNIGFYVEFTRRLSLGESVGQMPPPNFVELQALRMQAARRIPLDPHRPLAGQYRGLSPEATLWLPSYVRHAARSYQCNEHPELAVTSVKVYLVIHELLDAPLYGEEGANPYDTEHFEPFFEGEYDKEGQLQSLNDPLLGWLIPIYRRPKPGVAPLSPDEVAAGKHLSKDQTELVNYLPYHAGDVSEPPRTEQQKP